MNNFLNPFSTHSNQPKFLLNPYQQISCWSVCRAFDWQVGEKMLNLLLQLKEVALKMDCINKQRLSVSFDNWNPYNVWMDIVISEYLNGYIDRLREGVSLKKQFPDEFFSFWLDFYTLTRLMDEYRVFTIGEAFPSEEDADAFGEISHKISNLDDFLKGGAEGRFIEDALSYITDHKERERNKNKFFSEMIFFRRTRYLPKLSCLSQSLSL